MLKGSIWNVQTILRVFASVLWGGHVQPSSCAGPFTWSSGGYGPGNMQAWEAMMRMWGINPDSQRWQDTMRDLKRGESAFNQVCCVSVSCLERLP